MLCCVGLFGGMAVGQSLGGPWTIIAPVAGFGLGFLGDMTMMKRMHGGGRQQQDTGVRTAPKADPPRGAERDGAEPAYRLPDPEKV